jgi:hypothetical protein
LKREGGTAAAAAAAKAAALFSLALSSPDASNTLVQKTNTP